MTSGRQRSVLTALILAFGCTAALNGVIISKLEINPFIDACDLVNLVGGPADPGPDGGRMALAGGRAAKFSAFRKHGDHCPDAGVVVLVPRYIRREIYAVGSNERGAVLSGTSVVRAKVTAYALSGTRRAGGPLSYGPGRIGVAGRRRWPDPGGGRRGGDRRYEPHGRAWRRGDEHPRRTHSSVHQRSRLFPR